MMPCLIASAKPSFQIRSGKVRSVSSIGHDEGGMMEAADQIFPGAGIDPGLATDAAVDLREERGRNREIWDAAQINRGDKSGQVADDASA